MEQEPNRLRVKFVKHAAFQDIYVTGAHGGVGPTGDIYFVLHADRRPLPDAEEIIADAEGHAEEVRQLFTGDAQVVREMLVGVTMSADTAAAIAQWLLERAAEARSGGHSFPATH